MNNTLTNTFRQLSPSLAAVAIGCAGIGVAAGLDKYLNRPVVPAAHLPGTAAWIPHIAVAVVLAAGYLLARRRRHSGPNRHRLLLLAPVGRRAAARLVTTAMAAGRHPEAALRALLALPLLVVLGYTCWRVGEQVTAGLNPDFTVNAWGGPSYLGAMVCHYLDAALIAAGSAWVLDKLLLPLPPPGQGRQL